VRPASPEPEAQERLGPVLGDGQRAGLAGTPAPMYDGQRVEAIPGCWYTIYGVRQSGNEWRGFARWDSEAERERAWALWEQERPCGAASR